MKFCENCKKENTVLYGSGRFCSVKCSRGFSTKEKRAEINEKVSLKLKGSKPANTIPLEKRKCELCDNEYETNIKNKRRFCSQKCARTVNGTTPESRKKIRDAAIMRIKNGTHKGWSSRKIISYPEKFFMEVLKNNSIEYEFNYPVNKKSLGENCTSNYFLDFYIKDINLDLEIDGKQHDYTERKNSDIKRDDLLTKNGYKVYRIKWKSINTENGKNYIKKEIDKFLNYIKSLGVGEPGHPTSFGS